MLDSLDDELGDAVTAPEPYRHSGVGVQQSHLYLATVPRVHGAWRINDRDTVPGGEARSRMDEGCVTGWQRDGNSRAQQRALARRKLDVLGRYQVGARVTWMRVRRQRKIGIQSLDQHIDATAHDSPSIRAPGLSGSDPTVSRLRCHLIRVRRRVAQ